MIYGGFFCNTGVWTAGNGRLYYHIFRWPGVRFGVRTQGVRILSARSLSDGRAFGVDSADGRTVFSGLPRRPIDPFDSVIECDYAVDAASNDG